MFSSLVHFKQYPNFANSQKDTIPRCHKPNGDVANSGACFDSDCSFLYVVGIQLPFGLWLPTSLDRLPLVFICSIALIRHGLETVSCCLIPEVFSVCVVTAMFNQQRLGLRQELTYIGVRFSITFLVLVLITASTSDFHY